MSAGHARWWEASVADGDLVAGVFEGGGAKGILYEGALRAMVDRPRPRWFLAVAGSSAGAITALLVAAGLRPDQIAAETKLAVETLRPGRRWTGLSRLRSGKGYLSADPLAQWLREALGDSAGMTFAELYERTGVELHVVTVDLVAGGPMVFNYRTTPDEPVLEAALASAAIPFAFDALQTRTSMLVDGGVGTNFPRFVFNDPSYRLDAGLQPTTAPVVGFLLDEGAGTTADDGYGSDPPPARRGVLGWVSWLLLVPLRLLAEWIPGLMRRNTTYELPRYPRPKNAAARAPLDILDGVIMFAVKPVMFVITIVTLCLVTTVGAYHVVWLAFGHRLSDLPGSVGEVPGWFLDVVIIAVFSLIPVYALFIVLATFVAGIHVWPTGRRVGYGLLRTFLANPGSPSWAGLAPTDYVARLPVPARLTTLANGLNDAETAAAQVSAAAATAAVLDRLDAADGQPAGPRGGATTG